MSAITHSERDVGLDGVRRYRTKVKVRVDSHDRDAPLWISDDVVSVHTGKTVKGAGQANLMVLPRVNYMNMIRPNDYINIYFNIGDGEGWTRTFFGFVDRIEETYQVTSNGAPKTQYNILCTDFTKAFEKTSIYFNPHLAGRPDLAGEFFGTPNIGGLALMTSGVRVHGSPSDVVVNLVLLMLGFGTQFSLPPSYNPRFRDVFRSRRAQFIQNRLGEAAKAAIEEAGGYEALRDQIRASTRGSIQALGANSGASTSDRVAAVFRAAEGVSDEEAERIINAASRGELSNEDINRIADARIRDILVTPGQAHDEDQGVVDVLRTTTSDAAPSLLDVIDVFSFVERTAIDGYHEGYTVWQQQGPLSSFLRSMSHEIMNELIFDLRPVSLSEDGDGVSGIYSREPDEIEGNVDEDGGRAGIKHVPAMIMREYPFSTIDGIDLRGVSVQLDGDQSEIGVVYFGEIFSDRVNEPGRHAVQIPNINVADRREGTGPILATKIMDVAVVNEEEVIKTQLGRSDHEHFNLFEFYSDALLGQDQRFYMHDLLPIVTPVHVMRHGLRVRSLTTRFARFSLAVADRIQAPEPVEEVAESEEAAEEPEPVQAGDLETPCDSDDGARFRNAGFARWGYRSKPKIGPNGSWVFHQGIDIVADPSLQGTPAALEIPIRAIADGEVVVSAPEGVFGGYGNIVVIKHDFNGTNRLSVYAHLSSITVGPGAGVGSGSRRDRPRFAAPGHAGGRSAALPIRVQKGEQIGTMGNTGFSSGQYSRVHLHFEIDRVFPPRSDRPGVPGASPRHHFSAPPTDFNPANYTNVDGDPGNPGGWDDTIIPDGEPNRPDPPAGYDRSFDPVQFYSDNGIDLVASINQGSIITEGDSDAAVEPADADRGPVVDEDAQRPRDDVLQEAGRTPAPTPQSTSSRNNVDNALTRQQLIRWALLHDHWYQHNLEYLSGRVEMRGAPEIRVGYRLDLVQRNMSFYVESVNHQWQFPDKMTTVLQVTRGQRNDPYPMYVLPPIQGLNSTDMQRRTSEGRLAQYFAVPDPIAVRRALVLRSDRFTADGAPRGGGAGATYQNEVDTTAAAETYNESVVLSGSISTDLASLQGASESQLVRISGDLRYELDREQLERRMLEAFEFGDEIDGEPGDYPLNSSTSETSSGVTGRDLGAPLESDDGGSFA